MIKPMGILLATLALSGCASFPSCGTADRATGWTAVPESDETFRVREVAAYANVLDHGVSWGKEYWFKDSHNNYLLCANDCLKGNGKLDLDIRYAVRFYSKGETWVVEDASKPAC